MDTKDYQANFTCCGLIVPESREIARLLLQGASQESWSRAIRAENILQARSPATATSYAKEARARLQTMDEKLWELVADGDLRLSTQAVLAATVKHSRLLGDFMIEVLKDEFSRMAEVLAPYKWNQYMEAKQTSHPNLSALSASTQQKLRQNALKILAEAGYMESTRSRRLQTVFIEDQLQTYLKDHQEHYVLDCIEVTQ